MAEVQREYLEAGELGDPVLIVSHVSIDYKVKAQRGSSNPLKRLFSQIVGKTRIVNAVQDVSFVIRRGETVGLIGSNGAGKSSLIRVIAGVERPTSGGIWAASVPSMLSISGTLMKFLSGARNIRLGLLARGFTPEEVKAEYPKVLEVSELKEFIHNPLETYSSGMSARLKFAIAVSRVPEILLIDEALGTGDARFLRKSNKMLTEIKDKAGAIIMVNHAANIIAAQCTRVIWLERGRVIADGPTSVVLPQYEASVDKKPRTGRA